MAIITIINELYLVPLQGSVATITLIHTNWIFPFQLDCAYIKSRMNIAPTVAEGPSAAECSSKRPTKPSSPTNNCEKSWGVQLHDVTSIFSARNPNKMLLNYYS